MSRRVKKKPAKSAASPAPRRGNLPVYDTMQQCAVMTGIPLATLKDAKRDGCIAFKHSRVHLKELLPFLFRPKEGVPVSLEAERIRETCARANLLELEHREKVGELISMAEVQSLLRETLLPVRQRLTSLAATMGNRCNPSDPEFARVALQTWVEESLRNIRGELCA